MITFSSAFELLQAARTAARDLGSASVSQLLLDLQGQLLQLQVETLEQQMERREMTDEVARLRGHLAVQRKLERAQEAYRLVESKEDVRGPYCVWCWDARNTLQLLVDRGEGMGYCPNCKTTVKAESAVKDRRGQGQPAT